MFASFCLLAPNCKTSVRRKETLTQPDGGLWQSDVTWPSRDDQLDEIHVKAEKVCCYFTANWQNYPETSLNVCVWIKSSLCSCSLVPESRCLSGWLDKINKWSQINTRKKSIQTRLTHDSSGVGEPAHSSGESVGWSGVLQAAVGRPEAGQQRQQQQRDFAGHRARGGFPSLRTGWGV